MIQSASYTLDIWVTEIIMSWMISDVSMLSDHCMSAVISDVLTSNDHPFNASQHSMSSWQWRRDGDNLRVWWCLVSLRQDRNAGSGVNSWPWSVIGIMVSVSAQARVQHLHTLLPLHLDQRQCLKSKSNLYYIGRKRETRTGISRESRGRNHNRLVPN